MFSSSKTVRFTSDLSALTKAIETYQDGAVKIAMSYMSGGTTDGEDLRQALKEVEKLVTFSHNLPNHIQKSIELFTALLKTHHPAEYKAQALDMARRAREEGLGDIAERLESKFAVVPA